MCCRLLSVCSRVFDSAKALHRAVVVLAFILLLVGCRETTDGPSAWLSGWGTVWQVAIPEGNELLRQHMGDDTVVAPDSVHQTVWYLNRRGWLKHYAIDTGTSLNSIRLARRSGNGNFSATANPGTGGVFTLYRGTISSISSEAQLIASVDSSASEIIYDPLREVLWSTGQREIIGYNQTLEEVHRFQTSDGDARIRSFSIDPATGHVFLLLNRSVLHLDEQAQQISSVQSSRQNYLVVSRNGHYFTAKGQGVSRHTLNGTLEQTYRLPRGESVVDMATDWQTGELWVLSRSKLYRLVNSQLVAVFPESRSRGRSRSHSRFSQLVLMGGIPEVPVIEMIDPPEQSLVPLQATVTFSVASDWYVVNASSLEVIVNDVVQPATCTQQQPGYQCEVSLDTEQFNPQIRIRYVDPQGQSVVSAPLALLLDANGNGVADAIDDDDSDGLSNEQEQALGTDRNLPDTDGDLIPDGLELTLGLNPLQVDSDGNGVSDGDEDADGDQLTNSLELQYHSDPQNPDSDSDGLPDGLEVRLNLDPTLVDSDSDGIADIDTDSDGDGLPNGLELTLELDAALPDSDGNGIADGDEDSDGDSIANLLEILNGLDPADPVDATEDRDGDGLTNAIELAYGLNPDDAADALLDPDGDGLSNLRELVEFLSDPANPDTDGDGLGDGLEVSLALSPVLADSDGDGLPDGDEDADSDGLSNLAEGEFGTDPLNSDSDSDGLADGLETLLGLNPATSDSDGDGVADGDEDSDGDGIGNLLELANNLNPSDPADAAADADGDGLSNLEELVVHQTDPYAADSDGDGLDDALEIALALDPNLVDSDVDGLADGNEDYDEDGLANLDELAYDSDPTLADTDSDGINDGLEVALGLAPNNTDSDGDTIADGDEDHDGDGLANLLEIQNELDPADPADAEADADNDGLDNQSELLIHGTAIDNPDTDSDGLPDGFEVTYSMDPLLPDSDGNGVPDAEEDVDADGLDTLQELQFQTSPVNADSDGDGLSDGLEIALSLNPVAVDSDGDGISDGDEDADGDGLSNSLEVTQNLDPADAQDATLDADQDGLSNRDELLLHGTDIYDDDTDNDGLPDGLEVSLNLDPVLLDSDGNGINDGQEDSDSDGLTNATELTLSSDPAVADSDGDGLDDGIEVSLNLNPVETDTDGNGVSDYDEDLDADGLSNGEEVNLHQSNPAEFDSDGDGLGDGTEVGLGLNPNNSDTDADGVDDATDLYPTDPDRTRLAAVDNLQVVQTGVQLDVTWDAHPDTDKLTGYQLQRRDSNTSDPIVVLNGGTGSLSFADSATLNGVLYEYRVAAIDTNGELGELSEWQAYFLAYNDIAALAPQATRDDVAITLQWDALATDAYRIYRSTSVDAADFTLIAEQAIDSGQPEQQYRDQDTDVANAYYYRLSTVRNFIHPESGATIVREGPLSDFIMVEPFVIYEMQLTLLNAETIGENQYRQQVTGTGDRTVLGQYIDSRGPVRITATDDATNSTVSVTSSSGEFTLALPADGTYTIIAQDQHPTQSLNRVEVSLVLASDTTAPTISVAADQALSTAASEIVISGSVEDSDSEVSEVFARAERFGDTEVQASLGAGNNFTVTVPLLHGPNEIDLIAVDGSGNSASIELTIERAVSLAPVLLVSAPADGDVTSNDKVVVTGTVFTDQDIEQVAVLVNDLRVTPTGEGGAGGYAFSSTPVFLEVGINNVTIVIDSPGGSVSETIAVTRLGDDPPVDVPPPTISIQRPLAGVVSASQNVTLQGFVSSSSTTVNLAVDGVPLTLSAAGAFDSVLPLQICDGSTQQFELLATDALGQTALETLEVRCDNESPVITLVSPANLDSGAENSVLENPLPLVGFIDDSNLAALTLNGQNVAVVPDAETGRHRFDVLVQLADGEPSTIELVARDRAGNESNLMYSVTVDLPVAVQIVSPADGSTFEYSTSPVELDVIAQVTGLNATHSVNLVVNDGTPLIMNLTGDTARLLQGFILNEGENTVVIEVLDQDDEVIARARRVVVSEEIIIEPLALVRTDPVADSAENAPTAPLHLYFNQSGLDFDQISLIVTQSVHGLNYDLANQRGAGFTEIPKPELVEVHIDHEPVAGELARYPGDQLVSFYPTVALNYDATVYVDVQYQGESLSRFSYKIQELPTLINGIVTGVLGEALAGVEVAIPELELSTTTNDYGNFDFGAGLIQTTAIPSGRYRLVINPDQADANLGVVEQWANIQKSRINTLGRYQIPRILRDTPFVPLSGGKTVSLYGGAVTLDLTDANLRFPDGRDRGNVQVQMLLSSEFPHSPTAAAIPTFAWHLQPAGTEVSGPVGVSINIPAFRGGFEHVPPTETRVVLLGYDREAKQLMPVGTGRVDGRTIQSVGKVDFTSLDYIAYAIVPISVYNALWDWERGDIGTAQQLHSELLEAAQ